MVKKLNRLGKVKLPNYDEFEILREVEEKTHYICLPITMLEFKKEMLIPKEYFNE